MITEQLYGGKHDGLEVQTENRPDYIVCPDGKRYLRHHWDGRLYADDCRWDGPELRGERA